MVRAFGQMGFPDRLAFFVCGPFDGTIEIDTVIGRRTVSPHFEPGWTTGNALVIELFGRAGGIGMLPFPWVKGNDRLDLFGEQVVVIAPPIVSGIVSSGVDLDVELVFPSGFDQAVQAFGREREIGFAGLSDVHVQGQIVTGTRVEVLIKGVAEIIDFAIRIPPPIGRRVGIKSIAVAFEDAVLTARTGGGSIRRRARDEG